MKKFLMILCACLLIPFYMVAALLTAFFFIAYMIIASAILYLVGESDDVRALIVDGVTGPVRSIIKGAFWFMFPD